MKIKFWGVRGSIPRPTTSQAIREKIILALQGAKDIDLGDAQAIRDYVDSLAPLTQGTAGGNTPCIEVQSGSDLIALDAGTGLYDWGLQMMTGPFGRGQGTLHIFISHPHWDHIQGFTMFTPMFVPGNHIIFYGLHDVKAAIENELQMFNWAFTLADLRSTIEFVPLQLGQSVAVGKLTIDVIQNAHPGHSYSYRLRDRYGALVYATDVEFKELDTASVQAHVDFYRNADVLIFDTQYTLREGWQKVDWGHSSAMIGIDLARAAGVKKLFLFHHDPTYSDAELEQIRLTAIAYQAQDTSRPMCGVEIAREGAELNLAPPGAVEVELAPRQETAVLTPDRIFDEASVDQLAQQLAHLTEQPSSVIDLSPVETLTTAGLKALVALRKGQREPIVLAAPSNNIRQVIHLGGYQDYFAIYPSVEAASAAVQARAALNLPGQVLKGRYQIESKLGASGLGDVLKATDTFTGRPVALKLLAPSFSQETIDRFMRYASQTVNLAHNNIVKILSWEREGDYCFQVEEFMHAPTLWQTLTENEFLLPEEEAMGIAMDIARALEYAHSRGIIHTNLKPHNVFLTPEGAKVNGWGLGRLQQDRNLLEVPLLFLTADYLAPEQILGQMLDARTDLYALGVIFYQLLTGHLPFEGASRDVMHAHLEQMPRSPRQLNAQIPRAMEHFILRLLAKNPNDRYASAQQTLHISSGIVARSSGRTSLLRKPMVGREAELQVLRARWEEAHAGRGQIVLISGEPGTGKTSLAYQATAQTNPPVLLMGHCQEIGEKPAFGLFAQVLRTYFATVPPEFLEEQTCQLLSHFTRLVPELCEMLPALPELPALAADQEQLRLMSSLTQFIKQAAHQRPWFIVLDDLQWADSGSLELLRYLGHHISELAVLIVGLYRDGEMDSEHPLKAALRDLGNCSACHLLTLPRLEQAQVGQILAHIWQRPVPEALAAKIHQHTGGNPFFVEEVANGLIDDGLVTFQEGRWQFPVLEDVRLPASVQEIVWRRISRLSPDTRTLLGQAAILGQSFRFDDLRELSGLPEPQLLEHIDTALERQVVIEVPLTGEQAQSPDILLCFKSPEIRHVLYTDLGPLRRRILHRQAGEMLERRGGPDVERMAEELARQFGEAHEFDKAAPYSLQAARRAQAAGANDLALAWYRRAIEYMDNLPLDKEAQFEPLRAQTQEALDQLLAQATQSKNLSAGDR